MPKRSRLSKLLLLACVAISGCPGGGGGDGPGGGGPGVGGGELGSGYKPKAVGTGAVAVQRVATGCGGTCAGNAESARASFAAGDYGAAFDAWQCGDTGEAAFGAGLSKLLSAFESKAADQVLADLGMPHFEAKSLLGPDGYLSRVAARFRGDGTLELSGERAANFTFNAVLAGLPEEDVETSASDGSRRVSLNVWGGGGGTLFPAVGSYPVQFDCTTGARTGSAPDVNLSLYEGSDEYDCSVPYSDLAGCASSGGSFVVSASGQSAGDALEYQLVDLPLQCTQYDPDTGEMVGTPLRVVANGRLSATISDAVELSDLHPLYSGLSVDQVQAGVTLRDFVEHGAGIADDLATAACYFDLAAAQDDVSFALPGTSFGGDDLPLNAGDAKLFAAASALGGAIVQLARAYAFDLSLHDLACWADGGGEQATTSCPSDADFVALVNAAVKSASVKQDALQAARYLLELGLIHLDEGVDMLDAHSAFRRTADGEAGLAFVQAWARAG